MFLGYSVSTEFLLSFTDIFCQLRQEAGGVPGVFPFWSNVTLCDISYPCPKRGILSQNGNSLAKPARSLGPRQFQNALSVYSPEEPSVFSNRLPSWLGLSDYSRRVVVSRNLPLPSRQRVPLGVRSRPAFLDIRTPRLNVRHLPPSQGAWSSFAWAQALFDQYVSAAGWIPVFAGPRDIYFGAVFDAYERDFMLHSNPAVSPSESLDLRYRFWEEGEAIQLAREGVMRERADHHAERVKEELKSLFLHMFDRELETALRLPRPFVLRAFRYDRPPLGIPFVDFPDPRIDEASGDCPPSSLFAWEFLAECLDEWLSSSNGERPAVFVNLPPRQRVPIFDEFGREIDAIPAEEEYVDSEPLGPAYPDELAHVDELPASPPPPPPVEILEDQAMIDDVVVDEEILVDEETLDGLEDTVPPPFPGHNPSPGRSSSAGSSVYSSGSNSGSRSASGSSSPQPRRSPPPDRRHPRRQGPAVPMPPPNSLQTDVIPPASNLPRVGVAIRFSGEPVHRPRGHVPAKQGCPAWKALSNAYSAPAGLRDFGEFRFEFWEHAGDNMYFPLEVDFRLWDLRILPRHWSWHKICYRFTPQSYSARAERRRQEAERRERFARQPETGRRDESARRGRGRVSPPARAGPPPSRSNRPSQRSRTPPRKRARSESRSPPRPSHRSWGVPGSWGVPAPSPPASRPHRRPPSRPRADRGAGSSRPSRGMPDRGEGTSRAGRGSGPTSRPPEFVLVDDFPGVRIPLQVPDLQFAIDESARLNSDPDVPPTLQFSPLGHLLVQLTLGGPSGSFEAFLPSLRTVLESPLVTAKGSLPADLHFLDFLVQELSHPRAKEVFRRLALLFDSAGSFARRTRLERENLIPRDESEDVGLDYEDFPIAEADASRASDPDVVVVEREGMEVDEDDDEPPSPRRPSAKSRGKRRAS
ncbi:hypothetical protein C8F01DRAFT_1303045 [Mycena amicta]|nr:hypothetical protein C8F01DRAFT_1303045 [Mycena amicta]